MTDETTFLEQRPIKTTGHRQRPTHNMVNLEFINRLSQPKLYHHVTNKQRPSTTANRHKKKRLGPDEILSITNRLHSSKTTTTEKAPHTETRTPKLTHTEVIEITERLQRPLHRPLITSSLHRGPPKEIYELEQFVERLSTPKKSAERAVNRKVQIERRNLNKRDIDSLCHRLADPNYARKRTPDTNRVLDRTFSPVNTYAWQGLPYNPIDWKIYFPQY